MALARWKQYRRKGLSEMRPYEPGEALAGVSISEQDAMNGSPKQGDMVARNPQDHADQWLVSEAYFKANLERAEEEPPISVDKLSSTLKRMRDALRDER